MNEVSDPRYMQQSLDSDIEEVEIPIKHESKPYLMIPLPDGATNGDVIKALFYVKDVEELKCCTFVSIAGDSDMRVYKDWWNAPYERR